MNKALFISLGGSIEPVARSIFLNKPDYVVFFCSKDTYSETKEVVNMSNTEIKDYERIKTSDAQDLEKCFVSIISKLPDIIQTWDVLWENVIVDFTGGTKTMSAAMVISTLRFGVQYCYIGGNKRTKGGVGIVEGDGYSVYTNPWDELALFEKVEIELLFNNTNFEASRRKLNDLMSKVSDSTKRYYSVISDLVEGYRFWDIFNHKTALIYLNKAVSNLKLINSVNKQENISEIIDNVDQNIKFLREINKCCYQKTKQCEKADICYLCMDLLANAQRRAEVEHKYDDAVARLYRIIEKMAQVELIKYGMDTSNADKAKIPESIRNEYVEKYQGINGKIQFGLYASYELLYILNNNLGTTYKKNETKFKNIMSSRNNSILAHGNSPVKETTYVALYKFVIEFLNIEKDNLPIFPKIKL